jgi:threonine dehydrogenase-like Zn-dependent dehydrogenase
MKALMWTKPEKMELIDLEMPQIQKDEVLVEVKTVGICGSDLEGYLGHNSLRTPPLLMGHEFSGVIKDRGDEVKDLNIGDRIVVNPLSSCGKCPRCIKGYTNLCDQRKIVGIHRPGGYAEYVAVPASNVFRISDQLSFKRASLTEPLACALRASRRALAKNPFANVVVFGAGAIGLLSAFVCKILGASKVIVIDKNPSRLELTRQLGLDLVLESTSQHLAEEIESATGAEGVDVVIDAAGFQPTRELAMSMINSGGVFMNIGLGIDETRLPINHLIRSEIEIKGSFCYTAQDFTEALQLLTDGRITEEGWSIIRGLDEGQNSFQELVQGKVPQGKIFLVP